MSSAKIKSHLLLGIGPKLLVLMKHGKLGLPQVGNVNLEPLYISNRNRLSPYVEVYSSGTVEVNVKFTLTQLL